jgi:hypothetical protein
MPVGSPDGLREDVRHTDRLLPKHVGIDTKRDRRISMAKPSSDHVDGHTGQEQGRRMDVPQVVVKPMSA